MREAWLWFGAACALLVQLAMPAHAQEKYPSRPIRMVILVTPGGGSDVTARALAQKLTATWGQQVIVDNRPGAGGIVGMEITAKANPDGYTLVLGTIGPVAVNPSLHDRLPYDPAKDFDPVARAVSALNVLVVHPTLPVNSVKDLVAYAKTSPGPLNYGSSGAGAADHLAGELFNTLAGVRMQHVPYKGGAPAMVDLLGGNINLIFATVSTAVAHMKSGRIRPLAITAAKRTELFPDLPTIAEAGVPGFAVENWYGVIAPAGVPKPILLQLHREVNRILTLPDIKERLFAMGIVPFPASSPDEFGAYIKSEIKKYAGFVKATGARQ